jgi:hypothetical protein
MRDRVFNHPMPQPGDLIVVELPGEALRCKVRTILNEEQILFEVVADPMRNTHEFKKGDVGIATHNLTDYIPSWVATEPYREPEPLPPEVIRKIREELRK